MEQSIIRRLAVEMGYFPADTDVFNLADAEREEFVQGRGDAEFLKDAFWVDNGSVYVRRTRDAFPVIGPSCKYTALFDDRPEFDALRLLFLAQTDQHQKVFAFVTKLQNLIEETMDTMAGGVLDRACVFLETATAWSNLQSPTTEPPNFARRAWGAYTECVKDTSYYYSVAVRTVIAACAKRNVAIFLSVGAELRYETGYFGGVGPTVLLKLTGNNQRRVNSHFERLIPAEHIEELMTAWRAEEKERCTTVERRPALERSSSSSDTESKRVENYQSGAPLGDAFQTQKSFKEDSDAPQIIPADSACADTGTEDIDRKVRMQIQLNWEK